MILSSLAVLGTLGIGALGTSITVYRDTNYRDTKNSQGIFRHVNKLRWASRKDNQRLASALCQTIPQNIVVKNEETLRGLQLNQSYIRRYWHPYRWHGIMIIGCLLSYQGMQMGAAYLVKVVVDGAIGAATLPMLPFLAGTLLLAYPLGLWLSIKAEKLIAHVQSNISSELRSDLFAHLQKLSIGFFKRSQPGDISSRFITDIDTFVEGISYHFIYAVFRLTTVALIFTQLWLLQWYLALLVFAPLPFAVWLYNKLGPTAMDTLYQFKEREGEVNNLIQENIHIQPMLKSFTAEETFRDHFGERLKRLTEHQNESLFSTSLLRVTGAQSLFFCQVMATVGGAILVLAHIMSAGSLVAFLALWSIAKSNFSGAMQENIPKLLSAAGAGQRVEDILAQIPSIVEPENAYSLPPFHEAIRFEDVSFSYSERQANLQYMNLEIWAGQHVAIVGSNGAGKSTILNLLLRFYDPSAGKITIDGHDIRKVTQASLHAQIGIVFQDPLLFDSTIMNNIRISKPDAAADEITAAAQQAQIHDFIMKLPAGYETIIGEGGGTLSGGQRQKIAIARALLRDPAILILDEVTNGLDAESQAGLMEVINGIIGGRARTVITITHHMTELEHADQVLMLQDGQIVEFTTVL